MRKIKETRETYIIIIDPLLKKNSFGKHTNMIGRLTKNSVEHV